MRERAPENRSGSNLTLSHFTPLMALLLICFLRLVSVAQTRQPAPRDDTQVWSEVQIALPLNKQVDLVMIGALRFGRHVTRAVDERAGLGFSIKIGKYLTFVPTYYYIGSQPFEGRKSYEHRLSFAGTVRFPAVEKFVFSDRNTVERRYRTPQADSTRYRNRFQVEHPVKFGKRNFNLFASDEVFYDFSVDDWSRNRFSSGISRKFNKHFTGDFYYMRQSDRRTAPGDLNVIGMLFRLRP